MIQAYKTDIGAAKQAYCMVNGKSLRFIGFQVGTGGERDGQVLTVNRSDTILPGKVAEFDSDYITINLINGTSVRIDCKFESSLIAADAVSNVAIVAEVVGEPGTFLYCIGNFHSLEVDNVTLSVTFNN